MAGRSPARFLAPLALVAATVALLVVVGASPDEERPAPQGTAAPSGQTADPTAEAGNDRPRRRQRRMYTVKPGDTPSGIAEKTGVPLEDILTLNPELDPQTLAPGTKIRLRR